MTTSNSSAALSGYTSDQSVNADSPHHSRVTESDSSQHSAHPTLSPPPTPPPPFLPPPPPTPQPPPPTLPAPPTQPAPWAPSQIQKPTSSGFKETLPKNPETLFNAPSSSTLLDGLTQNSSTGSGRAAGVSHDSSLQRATTRSLNAQLERIAQLLERLCNSNERLSALLQNRMLVAEQNQLLDRLAARQDQLLESMNRLAIGRSK